jgi:GT2 family glycosyltransferase
MNAALAELGRRGHAGPVLLVNNDAEVLTGMRAALLAALPRDSAVPALVAPRILQDGHIQGWLYYQRWLALVTRRPLPGSVAYLSGCCLLVRRADNAEPSSTRITSSTAPAGKVWSNKARAARRARIASR